MRRVERRGSGRGEVGQQDREGGLAEALRRGDVAQDFGMGMGDGLSGRDDVLGQDAAVAGQDAAQERAVLAGRQGRAPDGFRCDAGVEVGDEWGESFSLIL